MKEYDIIVIGGGSGLDVASAYHGRDKKVAVIEPGPLGGTCLNRGCIPSKMLIHRADIIEKIENSEKFHIDSEINEINYEEIIQEVNGEVRQDAEQIKKGIENAENYHLYQEEARFVDEQTIVAGEEELKAEKIIVAAGTRPLVPPIEGLEQTDYMTSKEALELEEKPEEMVIIGGGYISVELAYFFQAIGTEIKIIEAQDQLVNREDEEISEKFTEIFQNQHEVHLEYKATEVRQENDKIIVEAENKQGETIEKEGDELLVAAGRVPNTDKLEVENAELETDERGFLKVDEYLQTNKDYIYALGDIVGKHLFKHAANLEAEHAFKNSFAGNKFPVNYTAMPHAIFSKPQIAGVGKTEQQLEENNTDYISSTYNYEQTGMGMALKEKDGFVKVLANPKDGEILGCHIIGPEASTLIHEVLVAMKAGTGKVQDIKDTIHIHPALNEVVQRAFNQL